MSEGNYKEKLVEVSMDIIMYAGDARLKSIDALKSAKKFEFKVAKNLMQEAEKDIVLAHKAHTEIIQDEAREIRYDYSVLFAHAQDTLMTVKSELSMANEMIDILEIVYKMK